MPEPVTTTAAIVAAVIKSALSVLPGAAGAAVSLRFLGGGLTIWQKVVSFCTGFACAVYLAPALIEWLAIGGSKTQSGVEFLVGLFALATVRELFAEINSADLIGSLKRKYLGSEK